MKKHSPKKLCFSVHKEFLNDYSNLDSFSKVTLGYLGSRKFFKLKLQITSFMTTLPWIKRL